MGFSYRQLGIISLFLISFSALAETNTQGKYPGKVIAGWIERISLNGFSFPIKAKLDSGAKTSSIHATDIKIFKKNEEYWVRFTVGVKDANNQLQSITLEKPRSRKVMIKNHDGDHDKRPVVTLSLCFDGRQHETEFTLTDRSEYIYPVLLGRAFLKGVAVIDPQSTYLTQESCQ